MTNDKQSDSVSALNLIADTATDSQKQFTQRLTAQSTTIKLRDGALVLYKRQQSAAWQYRFKLKNTPAVRKSTGTTDRNDAISVASDAYDEARYRLRLGLAPEQKRFNVIASHTIAELQREMASGNGKKVYVDYCSVIERYFIPYFANIYIANIKHEDVAAFEVWRNARMQKKPATSTLLTFSAAWALIQNTAINKGWISEHTLIPRLSVRGGVKAKTRPAFRVEEVAVLKQFMQHWCSEGEGKTGELRALLRDYVEMLLLTGMRHGTEAMRVEWRHCEWYWDKDKTKYLRMWVSGKTGERWLIAKHEMVAVLERRAAQVVAFAGKTLDEIFAEKVTRKVFVFASGQQPYNFNAVFRRMMIASDLLRDTNGQNRTLYSIRHTYATLELAGGTDIHTLARQMGTSVLMLERHYSKMTATMAAGKLAG